MSESNKSEGENQEGAIDDIEYVENNADEQDNLIN